MTNGDAQHRALVQALIYQPSMYAETHWRPYGLLFRNGTNAECYDANHAVIFDGSCDLDSALDDIERFYRARCMSPRVYSSYDEQTDARVVPALLRRGYTVEYIEARPFKKTGTCAIAKSEVKVARVKGLSNELAALLLIDGGPWSIGMAEYLTVHPDAYAYGAYDEEGALASYALLVHQRGAAIIQDVLTREDARRRGYCSAIIERMTREFESEWKNTPIYLFAENEQAISIYRRAGFEETTLPTPDFHAFLPG